MAAHPNLPESDAKQIVSWIQSLTGTGQTQKSLPASGSLPPTLNKPARDNGALYISASFTDKGGNNIKPLTGNTHLILRSNKIAPGRIRNIKNYQRVNFEGKAYLVAPTNAGWFSVDTIDMAGINGVDLFIGSQAPLEFGYTFEIRLDSPEGSKIADLEVPAGKATSETKGKPFRVSFQPVTDGKMHSLYFVSKPKDPKEKSVVGIQWIELQSK
jgi:hypothetical protein